MCARRRSNFLLSRQEKVTKEKATPSLRPPSPGGRRGQPAMLGPGVVPQNSLRSSNSAQTAAASQITKCVCPSAHAPTPGPALLGAASRGGERVPHGCCCAAAPGVGSRCALPTVGARSPWRAERSEGPQAERSNGPYGARFHPLLTVPRSAEAGVARVPQDTRASSSGSPQLFERSSKNAASSEAHPSFEHRRLPPRHQRGGHGQRGRLFLAYLLLTSEAKEGRCAAGRTPRPPHSNMARANHDHRSSHQPGTTAPTPLAGSRFPTRAQIKASASAHHRRAGSGR